MKYGIIILVIVIIGVIIYLWANGLLEAFWAWLSVNLGGGGTNVNGNPGNVVSTVGNVKIDDMLTPTSGLAMYQGYMSSGIPSTEDAWLGEP